MRQLIGIFDDAIRGAELGERLADRFPFPVSVLTAEDDACRWLNDHRNECLLLSLGRFWPGALSSLPDIHVVNYCVDSEERAASKALLNRQNVIVRDVIPPITNETGHSQWFKVMRELLLEPPLSADAKAEATKPISAISLSNSGSELGVPLPPRFIE